MPLTDNQQRVLTTLQQAQRPLSAYALLDILRAQGLRAPAQVYRALERLVQQGLVHRLETLNAYVTCNHPRDCRNGGVTAFAICDSCGHIDEIVDIDLGNCLGRWVKHSAFSMRDSTIELRGTCAGCQRASAN